MCSMLRRTHGQKACLTSPSSPADMPLMLCMKIMQAWRGKQTISLSMGRLGCVQDLWICLICGQVGCGRYRSKHAFDHWQQSGHCYSLELETQRVRASLSKSSCSCYCSIDFWHLKGLLPPGCFTRGLDSRPLLNNVMLADYGALTHLHGTTISHGCS